jgi:hypothetical protein
VRRAFIAVVVAVAFLAGGCFPHNKRHRRIAYIAELSTLGAGIAVLALAPPGADCDRNDESCKSRANLLSGIGVFLLLAGMGGFVATVSSAEEGAKPPPKLIEVNETANPDPTPAKKPAPAPKPAKAPEPAPAPAPDPAPAP